MRHSRRKSRRPRKRNSRRKKNSRSRSRKRSPYGNWKRVSPKKTSKRKAMLERYGDKCFLMPRGTPDNNYRPMFPICNTRGQYNCGGIRAARTRAAQWGYKSVEARANRLGKKLGCEWAKRSRSKSRRRSHNRSRRHSRVSFAMCNNKNCPCGSSCSCGSNCRC